VARRRKSTAKAVSMALPVSHVPSSSWRSRRSIAPSSYQSCFPNMRVPVTIPARSIAR
jgi:hypothetical protein